MRKAFIEELCSYAKSHDDTWLVCGDLGFSVLEVFSEQFPERYINAGVAEQNMTGIAAGLAMTGKKVITYSIANFPTLRCLEQIRNDVCYHKANVKIVSVGGGYAYGYLGYTHFGIEDIAIMRSFPDMTLFSPADPEETRIATQKMLEHDGPCYLRLGKSQEPMIHEGEIQYEIGQSIKVREGKDITLLTTGSVLSLAVEVADKFKEEGIEVGIISMPTVQPIDKEAIVSAMNDSRMVASIEEHSIAGGFGAIALETIHEKGLDSRKFHIFGIPKEVHFNCGSRDFLRNSVGLSSENIFSKLKESL